MTDLEQLRHNLETATGIPYAAYAWTSTPPLPYGTVNVVAQIGSVWGDGAMQEQALTGQTHLFTRNQDDWKRVQDALADQDFHWRLDGVLYEQDTRLLHYTWIWSDWEGI